MRKDIMEEIEVEGEVEIKGKKIIISKGENKIIKELPILVKKQDNKIVIEKKKANKRDKKLIYTTKALIKNMFEGLKNPYTYKLQICSVHFPMSVSVEKNKVIIKNFLGEVKPRELKLRENVKVEVDKNIITVTSADKELAGQTAADIEKTTKIKARDRRVFQDGIYMIEKCGRKI